MRETAYCELCGEPMPSGEEMFKYHGYSGPCPKPPLERAMPEPKARILEKLGFVSALFMSQGQTKADEMVMPSSELSKVGEEIYAILTAESDRNYKMGKRDGKYEALEKIKNLPGHDYHGTILPAIDSMLISLEEKHD